MTSQVTVDVFKGIQLKREVFSVTEEGSSSSVTFSCCLMDEERHLQLCLSDPTEGEA